MSEHKERAIKVLIILAILLVFSGTGFISSFERLYSGVTIAMLILIYLDGGGE